MCGLLFFWKNYRNSSVETFYDTAIPTMAITTCTGQLTAAMFEEFQRNFTIKKAVEKIKNSCKDPQILLWFTNHYGKVPQKGALWYKTNIFEKLGSQGTTFWLADIAAWRFLCTSEEELKKSADFSVILKNSKNNENLLTERSCPLVTDRSDALQESAILAPFAVVRSRDFYRWLNALPFTIGAFDANLADRIVRTYMRLESPRFSLKNIGYSPLFLQVPSSKLGKTLIEADHSQLFPLLQYLEGVYYTLRIVERCVSKGKRECTIVFLLPNKEFKYYMIAGEKKPFDTFRKNVEWFLQKQSVHNVAVKIYFYPFSYGNGFYNQPCEELEPYLTSPELIPYLGSVD